MPTNGYYPQVRSESWLFGEAPLVATADFDPTAKITDRIPGAPLFGMVWCEPRSTKSLVFSVKQSNDNGATDAFAAINIRVGGASVANVTVVPGGRVVFSLELQTKDWLQFLATRGAYGVLLLHGFNIAVERGNVGA